MTAVYQSPGRARDAAEKLRIYAQPQRLMILSRLLVGEETVGGIEAATGIGQPALSQQLAELRRADLVQTRREAKRVLYRLADEQVAVCVRSIEAIFGGGPAPAIAAAASRAASDPAERPPPQDGAAVFARLA